MKLLLSLLLMLASVSQAWAQGTDITINCPQDGPECEMVPNPGDPLFYETDMLPGDKVTRKLTVVNEDPDLACNLEVFAYNDRRSPDESDFPEKLFSTIERNGSLILSNTIQDIYDLSRIDLSTIPAGGTVVYDWEVIFDPNADNYYQTNETIFDFDVVFSCGDERVAQLLLTKTNNRLGLDNSPGDEVVYTLEVTAVTDVNEVTVIDLPPQGFVYRPGSWAGVPTEPTYQSPGKWYVGDMEAGEVVTMTYVAEISEDQLPGTYPDLAWASGFDADSAVVRANIDSGFFVGTEVRVVVPVVASAEYSVNQEGQVLGVSSELPGTGANVIWVVLGLLCLGIGLIGRKRFILIILVGILMTFFGQQVNAADLSIRLSQPKTPTNQKDLDLSFVVLDFTGEPLTVTCYKKAPSEADFTTFGNAISLISGGTSDQCSSTDSIINNQGTYQFKAVVNGGSYSAVSTVISVNYQTESADTPYDYSKDKTGCQYRIRFKTADDGKTSKVEIYRSDEDEFTVDAGSRIASINIGPDQDGEYTDTPSDCSKTYYYAVRAFTSSGSSSSLIGDSIATAQIGGTSAIATEPVLISNTSRVSQVNQPPSQQGLVLGETSSTTPAATVLPTPAATATTTAAADQPEPTNGFWWWWLVLPAVIIFLGYWLFIRMNR